MEDMQIPGAYIRKAYEDAGLKVELKKLPPARSVHIANNGKVDG